MTAYLDGTALCAQGDSQADNRAANSGDRADYSRDSALPLSPFSDLKPKSAHPNKQDN